MGEQNKYEREGVRQFQRGGETGEGECSDTWRKDRMLRPRGRVQRLVSKGKRTEVRM